MYLFSSGKIDMMGATVAIRTVRIDKTCLSTEQVKAAKAVDKIMSMHDENRKAQIKEQRRGMFGSVSSIYECFPIVNHTAATLHCFYHH